MTPAPFSDRSVKIPTRCGARAIVNLRVLPLKILIPEQRNCLLATSLSEPPLHFSISPQLRISIVALLNYEPWSAMGPAINRPFRVTQIDSPGYQNANRTRGLCKAQSTFINFIPSSFPLTLIKIVLLQLVVMSVFHHY